MAGWQGACGPEASIVGQDGAAAGKAETWAENAPGAPPAPAGRRPGGGGGGDGPMPRRASLRGLKSRIIVGISDQKPITRARINFCSLFQIRPII